MRWRATLRRLLGRPFDDHDRAAEMNPKIREIRTRQHTIINRLQAAQGRDEWADRRQRAWLDPSRKGG